MIQRLTSAAANIQWKTGGCGYQVTLDRGCIQICSEIYGRHVEIDPPALPELIEALTEVSRRIDAARRADL